MSTSAWIAVIVLCSVRGSSRFFGCGVRPAGALLGFSLGVEELMAGGAMSATVELARRPYADTVIAG